MKLIDPCYANKVLLKVARSYIHGWTSFNRTNCAQAVVSCHIPGRSIGLKSDWRLVRKGLKLIQPAYANKVLLRVHAFLYAWMDFFSTSNPEAVAIFLLYIERSVHLNKTTGWFSAGLKLIPTLR
jgi:hypothetical protein